ncbi:MAG: DUF2786 domain-containing protein [Actinomycetota bacterium]|nr:DUF2786 domain-containing protein [Actinomycetota bacterium]
MGTRNRQRRAEKRRRREKASAHRADRQRYQPPSVREVIYAAVGAVDDPRLCRELLLVLSFGRPDVGAEVEVVLGEALDLARAANWDETELARQVERRLGRGHAGYLDGRPGGLRTLDDLVAAIEVIAVVWALPPLPKLEARSRARSGDPRILEKVRALLAKAESTTFPDEAEALSAKAQELMARHSIEEAMVGSRGEELPAGVRVPVDDPYAQAKSVLLEVVASANRCRTVWSKDLGFSTVFGFESDLEFVDVLYTSLLVQATSAMVAAGSQVDRHGRSRTRSFRQSFLLAYANRIGHRLWAAEEASRAEAAEAYGDALLPVLVGRSAAVDAACAEAFPGAIQQSLRITNAAGWAAGKAADDLASLSGRTEVTAHR